LYGILVLAALVYLLSQFTWSYAHDYHYFSPLATFNGAFPYGNGGNDGPSFPANESFFLSILISASSYKVDLYGILVFATFVWWSSQSTKFYAHPCHYFSPLAFFNGALLAGCGGRPGPFFPAKLNFSKSTSDSNYKVDLYGILVFAAFVYLSNQSTWSWAQAYHYFSPLGFFKGALFAGCGGSPGPYFPARLNFSACDSNWTVD
jgi:hypothetical protein